MEESASGALVEGGEGGGMTQLPGESMEDYIKRLKEAGLYGGDITDQPLVAGGGPAVTGFGGVATPGSSAGLSVGSNMTSGGLSPGTGAGLSGKGMWEPDNSGSVQTRASPSGGGSMPGGDHKTNALNVLLNNTSGNMAQSKPSPMGYVTSNFGNITPMASPTRRTNALLQYLQYVKPAYRGPTGGPISLDGNPATNYLSQLMRGGR